MSSAVKLFGGTSLAKTRADNYHADALKARHVEAVAALLPLISEKRITIVPQRSSD